MEPGTVLLIGLCIVGVSSYPSGPPISACMTLTPNHGSSQATGAPPFEITADVSGDDVLLTVTKTGSNQFKGFIIQAREGSSDTTPVGTFTMPPAGTKLLDCTETGSTWTHSNNDDKDTVTTKWSAPYAGSERTLFFQGTVVQEFRGGASIYYEGLMTANFKYNGTQDMMMTTQKDMMMTTKKDMMMTTKKGGGGAASVIRASLLLTVVALLMKTLVTGHQ